MENQIDYARIVEQIIKADKNLSRQEPSEADCVAGKYMQGIFVRQQMIRQGLLEGNLF